MEISEPAGTVMVFGTATTEGLEETRGMLKPLDGAGDVIVRLAEQELPPTTAPGLKLTESTYGPGPFETMIARFMVACWPSGLTMVRSW